MEFPFWTCTPSQSEIFSQSCYCGLFIWSFFSGPAHLPKEKYSLSKLLLRLALSGQIRCPFRTSTPSQSEIFSDSRYCGLFLWSFISHPPKEKYSLTAVIVACSLCSYMVAFQDQYTLPKRNILSKNCYCGLLSLLIYIGLSGPALPPKVKYSFKLLLWLAVSACMYVLTCQDPHTLPQWNRSILSNCYCGFLSLLICMYWPFKTSTPSQSEIFSQAVIVTSSLCSYVCIGLSGPAHSPKEKYSLSKLLLLLVRMEFSFRTSTPSQSEIFSQKLLLCLLHMEFPFRTSTPCQREIFSQSVYGGLLSLVICVCHGNAGLGP